MRAERMRHVDDMIGWWFKRAVLKRPRKKQEAAAPVTCRGSASRISLFQPSRISGETTHQSVCSRLRSPAIYPRPSPARSNYSTIYDTFSPPAKFNRPAGPPLRPNALLPEPGTVVKSFFVSLVESRLSYAWLLSRWDAKLAS